MINKLYKFYNVTSNTHILSHKDERDRQTDRQTDRGTDRENVLLQNKIQFKSIYKLKCPI